MSRFYDKTWKKIVLVLVALVVILGVVGGTSETPEPEAKPAAVSTSDKCIRISQKVQKTVLQDLKPVGKAWAVRSDDYFKVWMVASEFELDGETQIGVWGIDDLRANLHSTVAVDGMADQFTTWPHKVNGEEFSIANDGAQEAVDCVESR